MCGGKDAEAVLVKAKEHRSIDFRDLLAAVFPSHQLDLRNPEDESEFINGEAEVFADMAYGCIQHFVFPYIKLIFLPLIRRIRFLSTRGHLIRRYKNFIRNRFFS